MSVRQGWLRIASSSTIFSVVTISRRAARANSKSSMAMPSTWQLP